MRPRKRDSSFLLIAAIAAAGGVLSMVLAIGLPLWDWAHGRAITPAFAPFAGWGAAALGGAYACVRTYLISGEPPKPPKGGMRLAVVRHAKAVGRLEPSDAPRERAA